MMNIFEFKDYVATPQQRLCFVLFCLCAVGLVYFLWLGESPFNRFYRCMSGAWRYDCDARYAGQRIFVGGGFLSLVGMFWPYTYGALIKWIQSGRIGSP